jgi:uncharacterized protein
MAQAIPLDVPRRRLDFPFTTTEVPQNFYAGDPSLSLFLVALSLVFPEGERFFVESVVRYRDRIDDPALMARVRGFAAQEAMHSKEHAALNAVVEAQGLTVMAKLGRDVAALLRRGRRVHTHEEQLAITCALEHITAILGEQVLVDDEHREAIHESVRGLFTWHALEECEHKDVAYDVYEAVGGTYRTRVIQMALATFGIMVFVGRAHLAMLAERGLLSDLPLLARTVDTLWLRGGLFRKLVPRYLAYFRRGFHPSQIETRALVEGWRERLFGEGGELRSMLDAAARREKRAA